MKKRKDGFYWIRYNFNDTRCRYVAEWSKREKRWLLPGISATYKDEDFQWIDERRLKR